MKSLQFMKKGNGHTWTTSVISVLSLSVLVLLFPAAKLAAAPISPLPTKTYMAYTGASGSNYGTFYRDSVTSAWTSIKTNSPSGTADVVRVGANGCVVYSSGSNLYYKATPLSKSNK